MKGKIGKRRRSAKRTAGSLKRVVSRAGLIETCRLAYRYVLSEISKDFGGQKRLTVKEQRELGRRLALTWSLTSPANGEPSDPQVRCDDLLCGIFPPHTKKNAMATLQRFKVIDGKGKWEGYEVPVRVMAVTEGYAMVRRKGCSPMVLEAKRVRLIPHNAESSDRRDNP